MKRCTLLPVVDNVDGAIAYKVFEFTEKYLRSSTWCSYRSNTELLNVFSNYRDKLDEYLDKPEVLKTVSEKLNVGSIIRVKIQGVVDGIRLRMFVYGDNGEVMYYENSTLIQSENIEAINLTLRDWLREYSTIIPYDGMIVGVLGDQITFDVGRSRNFKVGQSFTIRKFNNYKKHPLLNSVVEWDSELIGRGKVFNFSGNQAVGIVKVYKGNFKVDKGNWIIIDKNPKEEKLGLSKEEIKENQFGKLGIGTLFFEGGDHSVKAGGTTSQRKVNGILLGVSIRAEAWITRNYFGVFEYGQRFGNLKEASTGLSRNSYGIQPGVLKIIGGYRFLPMRFFYGPRLDVYSGWAKYTYSMDLAALDGFGAADFGGFIGGVKFDMPIMKDTRAYARAEVILDSAFNDSDEIYEETSSTSSLQFEIGSRFKWNPIMFVDATLQVTSNKAKFKSGTTRDLQFQDSSFKVGLSYLF